MKMLRSAAIAIAVVVACTLVLKDEASFLGIPDKPSCGGFKPETRMLCWGSQA